MKTDETKILHIWDSDVKGMQTNITENKLEGAADLSLAQICQKEVCAYFVDAPTVSDRNSLGYAVTFSLPN